MITCKNCGSANEDGSAFCGECGAPLDASKDSSAPTPHIDSDAVVETITDVADKTVRGAKDLAGKINATVSTTLENQRTKANEAAQKEIAQAQKKATKQTSTSVTGTDYMSSTELWSWLQKSSKRQHFFTEEENTLSAEEYISLLAKRIAESNVPANVHSRRIQWDRSNVMQDIYLVQPVSNAVNPLSCLVQFNHVGKFTFVEEKTFITPPDLPEVPEKKVPISEELRKQALYLPVGIGVAIIGLLFFAINATVGIVAILCGAALAWFGFSAQQKLNALQEHNRKCDRQEAAWNAAWGNWEDSIFLHSFQENVNGQISRIYDSVFECIKQLNSELFSQEGTGEDEASQSMNELEQLIARRKDNYR